MAKKRAKKTSVLLPFGSGADRDAQREEDYRALFGSTRGRRVLADILNEGGLFRPHIKFDDRSLAVMEGRRSLALEIFTRAGGLTGQLGRAMTDDNIGEALNVPDADRAGGAGGNSADADDPGERGDPLFAKSAGGPDLIDGD